MQKWSNVNSILQFAAVVMMIQGTTAIRFRWSIYLYCKIQEITGYMLVLQKAWSILYQEFFDNRGAISMLLCILLCFFSQCSTTNIHAIYFSSNENLLNSPPNRFDGVCIMPSCFPWLQFGCVFACQDSKELMAILRFLWSAFNVICPMPCQ